MTFEIPYKKHLVLAATLLLCYTNLAKSETLSDVMENYNRLFSQHRYDEAYALIQNISDKTDPVLYMERGLMLGRGLLSTGVDRCGAIRDLEKAYNLGMRNLIPSMDFLYAGDWAAIAALEGNADALYIIGNRIFESNNNRNMFYLLDTNRNIKESYPYFLSSSNLGNYNAKKKLDDIKNNYQIDAIDVEEIEFSRILCAVRSRD